MKDHFIVGQRQTRTTDALRHPSKILIFTAFLINVDITCWQTGACSSETTRLVLELELSFSIFILCKVRQKLSINIKSQRRINQKLFISALVARELTVVIIVRCFNATIILAYFHYLLKLARPVFIGWFCSVFIEIICILPSSLFLKCFLKFASFWSI